MLCLKFDFVFLLVGDLFHQNLVVLVLAFKLDLELVIQLYQRLVFLVGLLGYLRHQPESLEQAVLVILFFFFVKDK